MRSQITQNQAKPAFGLLHVRIMTPSANHPITDMDAKFSAVDPKHTHRVMEALRQAGIEFDVTVNGPKDDPAQKSCDIFWFRPEADHQRIGDILCQVTSDASKA